MNLKTNERDWNEKVREVVVILSASRSGSSLIFKALSSAKDVIAPAGEHEPWLFLSKNKFPYTDSDSLVNIDNKQQLLALLRNDLLIRKETIKSDEFRSLLGNRLTIRSDNDMKNKLDKMNLPNLIDGHFYGNCIWEFEQNIVQNSFKSMRKYYEPIENPPYIIQPLARRATLHELSTKTLLFKSPSDAYRPGFYEELFPQAKIKYIHLTRGFAQTVNGLMDGWSRNETDFISNAVGRFNQPLNIQGYSKSKVTKAFWCFDLFPNWRDYTNATLAQVCTQQWLQAHSNIIANFSNLKSIDFESFYLEREAFLDKLESYTGISVESFNWDQTVMSTDRPVQFRWLKRETLFRDLDKWIDGTTLAEIATLQKQLGYSMETSTWY